MLLHSLSVRRVGTYHFDQLQINNFSLSFIVYRTRVLLPDSFYYSTKIYLVMIYRNRACINLTMKKSQFMALAVIRRNESNQPYKFSKLGGNYQERIWASYMTGFPGIGIGFTKVTEDTFIK